MRILVLSFYYQPDLCAGSFRCTALVDQLLKKDKSCIIDVITTLPNRYDTFSVIAPKFEQSERLTIHRIEIPSHKSGMLDQIKAFYFYYKNAMKIAKTNKYKLVFATSSRLFTAFLGARIARQKKLPLFLDIRDIFVDTLKDVLPSKVALVVTPILSLFEKYTFARVAKVNLVSGGFLNYFKLRYPCLDYELYTNGIDEEFINIKPNNILPNKPVSSIKTILYAGNIGEGQGLHRIIPELSLKIKNNFRLLIIGDGGRKPQLVDAINKLDVKNVEFIPPVNRQQLIEYYKQADVLFLHLNDYIAFEKVLPSKVFEYAVFNKPILAGVSGYAAKFITDNVSDAHVFPPCNSEAAFKLLNNISFECVNREEFIKKFSRKSIMSEMSSSILSLKKKS